MVTRREEVPAALDGERLDRVVSFATSLSRSAAAALVADGAVTVDGEVRTVGRERIGTGAVVEIAVPEEVEPTLEPDPSIDVPVVWEDEHLVVVDKPAGLVVHPGAGHESGTLVHGLVARYPEVAEVGEWDRPGIVHRLDAGTSGLMAVARTEPARAGLVEQLSARTVGRTYLALVWGHLESPVGVVDAPIGRSIRTPTRMAVTERGREARTHYEVERAWDSPVEVSLLRCNLETGRTHQIRVHLTAIGHPVVGDATYGGYRQSLPLTRPFLHATRLAFRHPVTGEDVVVDSPLPADLVEVLARLDREA